MSIAFVNGTDGGDYNNSAGNIVSSAIDVSAGNALVVFGFCGTGSDSTITNATCSDTASPPNTFTRVANACIRDASNGHSVVCFVALNTTAKSGDVITITIGVTGYIAISVLQFSGIATSNAIDAAVASTISSGSAATSITSPSFSTASADEVAIYGTKVTDTQSFSAGSGYAIPTGVTDTYASRGSAEYQIFTSTQSTITAVMSGSAIVGWAGGLVSLKMAAAGGGAPIPIFMSSYRRRR